jgi:hypothetical protein
LSHEVTVPKRSRTYLKPIEKLGLHSED